MTRIRVRCVTCGSPVTVDPVWVNFAGVLPPVTPIPGLNVKSANDLLSPEAKASLDTNLRDMARARRAGNAAAATMTLSGIARLLPRGLR